MDANATTRVDVSNRLLLQARRRFERQTQEQVMTKRWIAVAVLVLVGVGYFAGVGLLTAEDQKPRSVRVSPSVLKEALNTQPVTTAATAPSLGHSIQDLRTLAADLDKAGHKAEADRLKAIVKNLTHLAERRYAEKKDQVEKLQAEMEELKWAADR
jgi:hypothetical protein